MPAANSQRTLGNRRYTTWDRARLSVVVPVGVIVAVAIVCIVVAVLSSARRADEVAIEHERQLFSSAIDDYGERVLRELASVAGTKVAADNVREHFDPTWAERNITGRLISFFGHDRVFVLDGQDQIVLPASAGRQNALSAMRIDSSTLVDLMRGRRENLPGAIGVVPPIAGGTHSQAAVIHTVMGHPAILAAVAVNLGDKLPSTLDVSAPLVMSVKFIDHGVLAEIGSRLQIRDLRMVDETTPETDGDFSYDLQAANGDPIVRFAWTPKQPGAEIVNSVVPFIAVALAGFALLAAFVLGYMRRTAAAIAAGESRLRHLAMHDPLCGLPNRVFFSERLEAAIEGVRNGGAPAAVFYIDLDHFKEVNDTLGHPVGDELIRNVTLRLSRVLRGDDLVARLGGDEFAVISTVGADPDAMAAAAQRIISSLCAPYSINRQTIVIGASIGIAVIDRNCGSSADIMRYADMALYRAKNEGRNRACVYDAVMDADLSSRKLLENELRTAIESDGLTLLYQPLVNTSGEVVVGVEALCRWSHPERGEIPPAEFIPVAEHSGLIIELGEWVLRRACLDGKNWPGLSVAVNVSPLQFRRADFVETGGGAASLVPPGSGGRASCVGRAARAPPETGFDPARLELEVTESTLIGNVDTAEAAMRRLKALGVRLALDDFGTGYSSLLYLRRFPFDKLKIDRSFVRSIEKAADAAAIVHAVVSLGRGLGMKVTAEGVETADQHLFLRAAGVHSMQGYRFGKAVSVADISRRIQTAAGKPTALAG